MRNSILLFTLFSLLIFWGCPSSNNSYEDENRYVEEEVYEEEYYEEETEYEKEPHHLENPADIAGDLIF